MGCAMLLPGGSRAVLPGGAGSLRKGAQALPCPLLGWESGKSSKVAVLEGQELNCRV